MPRHRGAAPCKERPIVADRRIEPVVLLPGERIFAPAGVVRLNSLRAGSREDKPLPCGHPQTPVWRARHPHRSGACAKRLRYRARPNRVVRTCLPNVPPARDARAHSGNPRSASADIARDTNRRDSRGGSNPRRVNEQAIESGASGNRERHRLYRDCFQRARRLRPRWMPRYRRVSPELPGTCPGCAGRNFAVLDIDVHPSAGRR